jgi:UDP-N-acetylglucosamine--dolichyl-phosphate N-acetylglucosaminephosphotransferase
MVSFSDVIYAVLGFTVSFVVTFILVPLLIRKFKEKGIVGTDIHKSEKPEIPEMGGLSILISTIIAGILLSALYRELANIFIVFLIVVVAVGIIGAIDDIRPLNPKLKPILTALAGLPIILLGTYVPRPVLPIIGKTRLTIVYPLLILASFAVSTNAVNMLDIFNGAMAGTCGILFLALLIASIILGSEAGLILSAIMLGSLIAFYYYNKYPAKIFSGDVGSLAVGAAIAATAIIGRLEIITIVAMMPHIMNGFHSLASIGGLLERRQIKARPTKILSDGRLVANEDPKAPITLARLILAGGPLYEYEIVKVLFLLSAYSGLLAIITALIIAWGL